MNLDTIYFALFAAICTICALGVLVVRHPIHGVINLIGVMLGLAGIYALVHAPFLAVLQVLVYAGAIMMLLVFVIMVLNQAKDDRVPRTDAMGIAATVVPAVLLLLTGRVLASTGALHTQAPGAVRGSLASVAARMFDTGVTGPGWYLLFEAGGVLLLAAVVGAVVLAKRRLDSAAEPETAAAEEAA